MIGLRLPFNSKRYPCWRSQSTCRIGILKPVRVTTSSGAPEQGRPGDRARLRQVDLAKAYGWWDRAYAALAFRLHQLKAEAGRRQRIAAFAKMLKKGDTI